VCGKDAREDRAGREEKVRVGKGRKRTMSSGVGLAERRGAAIASDAAEHQEAGTAKHRGANGRWGPGEIECREAGGGQPGDGEWCYAVACAPVVASMLGLDVYVCLCLRLRL
jgi:hypothetical protein